MGSNPINLAIRFLLELAALSSIGYWGWTQHEGGMRFFLAIGLPLLAAALWGTFAVPDDPSRSGKAPVPVAGIIRLALELAFFAAATWLLFDAGQPSLGRTLGVVVLIHYLISYDRIGWLLKR
ncbi:MAG: YrdB family protein [Anaerolineales bacterium]|uniref:YrdB family protein n=1 Tax=Candidatus Desulfolinea nitratireducens TaxID=2841698 RepID=A0A8J6NMN4_9CHLR|nr:YrdB family protein [Candidatus Desulfolinea nitratireducens]MBL6959481.1 YrdB family protein [Anaerolineales bacterium]